MSSVLEKELTFACALANPAIRSVIGTYYQDLDWSSKLAENVSRYFMAPGVSQNDFNPIEFRQYQVENDQFEIFSNSDVQALFSVTRRFKRKAKLFNVNF